MTSIQSLAFHPSMQERYKAVQAEAKIDITIKRLALATLVLLNFTALCFAYRALVFYHPNLTQSVINYAFIFGVLGALISMKFPTCGITENNVDQFVNPLALCGRVLTYLFFAPVLFTLKYVDFNDYSDPEEVSQMALELSSDNFEYVMKTYGWRIHHLEEYGVISENDAKRFQEIYSTYLKKIANKEKFEKRTRNSHDSTQTENYTAKNAQSLEESWQTLKNDWVKLSREISLPNPPLSDPNGESALEMIKNFLQNVTF